MCGGCEAHCVGIFESANATEHSSARESATAPRILGLIGEGGADVGVKWLLGAREILVKPSTVRRHPAISPEL